MAGLNPFKRQKNPINERIKLGKDLLKIVNRYEEQATTSDTRQIKKYLNEQLANARADKVAHENGNENNIIYPTNNRDLRDATLEYLGRTIIDNNNKASNQMVKDLNKVHGKNSFKKDLSRDIHDRDLIRNENGGLNRPINPNDHEESNRIPPLKVKQAQEIRENNAKLKQGEEIIRNMQKENQELFIRNLQNKYVVPYYEKKSQEVNTEIQKINDNIEKIKRNIQKREETFRPEYEHNERTIEFYQQKLYERNNNYKIPPRNKSNFATKVREQRDGNINMQFISHSENDTNAKTLVYNQKLIQSYYKANNKSNISNSPQSKGKEIVRDNSSSTQSVKSARSHQSQ
ncbi:hypothetical protein [Pseudobutyrivibrio ruminis]|uniref:Uncharacterized protein n=1 Tax=Pseudobutyrivibrio ruminis TaxID=46206 RepID=A0A2G3DVA0_9FIRM|nr:hypothetical protein [Pseudobutyrivibrio ruminis]PHU34956.1 hypothetical protein CSX01_06365 [Pseudobutyrivibrio ruminis]